jgi:hypothetical protein
MTAAMVSSSWVPGASRASRWPRTSCTESGHRQPMVGTAFQRLVELTGGDARWCSSSDAKNGLPVVSPMDGLGDGGNPRDGSRWSERRDQLGDIGFGEQRRGDPRASLCLAERVSASSSRNGCDAVEVALAIGAHDEEALVVVLLDQMAKEQDGRSSRPVQVLHHEHQRVRPGQPAHQCRNGVEQLESGQHRLRFTGVRGATREQSCQRARPGGDIAVSSGSSRPDAVRNAIASGSYGTSTSLLHRPQSTIAPLS